MRRQRFIAGLAYAGAAFFGARARADLAGPATPAVRVRLFASDDIVRADVATVHLDASSQPTEVSAQGGTLRVTAYRADGSSIARDYMGSIRSTSADGKLVLVNAVDVQSYVSSVLASEISPRWNAQALQAQAIAVRTYALHRMVRHRAPLYDVVDTTANQVYRGTGGIYPSHVAAAAATDGRVLTFAGGPADVWYHSACGGHTAAASEVTGFDAAPYLRGVPDADESRNAYCAQTPYFKWRNTLAAVSMARVVDLDAASLASLTVSGKWEDGRVRSIRVVHTDGSATEIAGHAFYSRAAAVLGYKVVPSALFDITLASDGRYAISGRGVGHGVGMCQWGAQGRALAGQTAAQILAAYFPGTEWTAVTFPQTAP